MIDYETGVITERDESLFAEAVITLLLDEGRKEKMGQKTVEVIRVFWTLEHARERLL